MKNFGRWTLVMCLAMAILWISACGSDKYADAKSLMKEQTRVAVDYVNGLEKASNANDVAQVINTYTDDMKALIPRVKEFRKKYPELSSMSPSSDVPEDVKAHMEKLQDAMNKIQSATMNLMKYMMDPKVQKAMQRMGSELGPLASS